MKKNIIFLLVFIICSLTAKAQGNSQSDIVAFDSDGNSYTSGFVTKKKYPIKFTPSESIFNGDSIRPLTEINTDTLGCGYPYISSDGLRLYFTKSVNVVSNMNLYFVSRTSISSPFNNRQIVSSNFTSGSTGCWLTNDELDIYFRKNDSIFYSTRTSITNPFSNPSLLNLSNYKGNIQGISLTPDKHELYINKNIDTKHSYVLRFISTSISSYTLLDTLKTPLGTVAKPGQLSKNGLKYYVALKDTTSSITKLYQYSRNNLSENFSNPTIFNSTINTTILTNSQATATLDENIMVWVKNNNGFWGGNTFYMSIKNSSTKISELADVGISIYQDLSKRTLFMKGLTEAAQISIYELSGRLTYKNTCTNNTQIDISKFQNGVYIIRIETTKGLIAKKFIK